MTTFSFTSGNPSSLTAGATANMNDISGSLTDLRTFLNGGTIDSTNTTAGPGVIQTAQAWQTLALTGFTTSLSYMKDGFGFVHLRTDALTTTGSPPGAAATIGTLPAGYRPVNTQYFSLVRTDGTVPSSVQPLWSISSAGVITNVISLVVAGAVGYAIQGGVFRGEN